MRKHNVKILALGLAVITAVSILPIESFAGRTAEEKPLAGITLSMDHYCDAIIAEKADVNKENDDTAKVVKAGATEAVQNEVVEETVKEDKDKEEKIKLNLNLKKVGIAKVDNYLNVRKKPSENSKLVGKMTKNAGCNVISTKKGWSKIESGKVKGYVKSSYLITGKEAQEKAVKVASMKAIVKTQTLNVRYLPSTDSRIYDQLSEDEDYEVEKENLTKSYMDSFISKHASKKDIKSIDKKEMYGDLSNWVMLSIDDEKVFVSKDFINTKYCLNKAVTIKESKKSSKSDSSSNGSSSMVSYAMQFLGNPYVWGGTSLTHGTDCSGFTQGIYRHFGISIPRTSSAQAAASRSVSRSEARAGDLFFYGSGRVSHVALYMGNGQVIHASNRKDGIKISNAYYRKPLKIGRFR